MYSSLYDLQVMYHMTFPHKYTHLFFSCILIVLLLVPEFYFGVIHEVYIYIYIKLLILDGYPVDIMLSFLTDLKHHLYHFNFPFIYLQSSTIQFLIIIAFQYVSFLDILPLVSLFFQQFSLTIFLYMDSKSFLYFQKYYWNFIGFILKLEATCYLGEQQFC